jgi:oligopeptide transport system substrate-binding protein
MRRSIILILPVIFIGLFSCNESVEQQRPERGVGGKMYGGEFRFMSSDRISSLFPISTVDIFSQRIISQIFEPILHIDPSGLKVVPGLAESYTVNEEATVFTFTIRKGVFFHDDPCFNGKGRELVAKDVKFCLDLACSGLPDNKVSYLLIDHVKGAIEFQKKSKVSLPSSGVSGVQVKDKYTLEIQLNDGFSGFDKILTNTSLGVFPKEAYLKYGDDIKKHPVGTGPFVLESSGEERVILKRNNRYWRKDDLGNQLPFLDRVVMLYSKDKRSELMAFRNKEIDMVLEIPVEEIENILGSLIDAQNGKNVKHRVESETSMSVTYVGLACESEEFKDLRVRKAFNLAVNTNRVVDDFLEGEGWAATHGFVPPMDIYPNEKVKPLDYNAELARRLFADAGYSDGKSFPMLDFYVNAKEGSSDHKLAQGVSSQLKENLNIDLNIKLCDIKERDEAIASGKAKIWRTGWIADYPDPQNFLSLFYSGNISQGNVSINPFKYRSPKFDEIYLKALKELDTDKRNDLLVQCDQMIIDDGPVIPILTDDYIVMINARVRNFKTNSMEVMDLSTLFIKEPRE